MLRHEHRPIGFDHSWIYLMPNTARIKELNDALSRRKKRPLKHEPRIPFRDGWRDTTEPILDRMTTPS